MSTTKLQRDKKRQMGQFLTPQRLATVIVGTLSLQKEHKVLEPSMGDGSFIIPLIEKFLPLYNGNIQKRLNLILTNNIWGIELDAQLYENCLTKIREKWGYLPERHNFKQDDFFATDFRNNGAPILFDFVVGNPPFGGSFNPSIEDELDAVYGMRDGTKIKKETYAFFIVRSTDLLKKGGTLVFICSDTFLTINTMRGLRLFLMTRGDLIIEHLEHFSNETSHPMVILRHLKNDSPCNVIVGNRILRRESIQKTGNLSFGLKEEFEKYFEGPRMGDFFIATSGMTTGKNEYFVREIQNGFIEEQYAFSYIDKQINIEDELRKARLGKLPYKTTQRLKEMQAMGQTCRTVHIEKLKMPTIIKLPDKRYRYYNKATNSIIYTPPTHVIYWEDDGDAVLTYKRNGNWYLRGIGGQPFFMREGITWQLIASRMHMSYLPAGYILDSGAPCAFPRGNTDSDEIFFALGWTLTAQCNKILKEVINHTKNIQSKDFERLPYPFWVSTPNKREIITLIKTMIAKARRGQTYTYQNPELNQLEILFSFPDSVKPIQSPIFVAIQKELALHSQIQLDF